MTLRITEQSHPLTQTIDQGTPAQMIANLQAADRDLFLPNALSQSLADHSFQQQLALAQVRIRACLKHPNGRVIMGGAGTSGRLALIAARQVQHPRVIGLLAGGVDAFFKAAENVEDLPQIGSEDLAAQLPEHGPCVYIGISCGLSAAYVAGQIQRSLQQPDSFTIMLGFNPASDANRRDLPGIHTSMYQLVQQLQEKPQRGLLLNPTIGPEPITGSTRMKGGSATKIILDSLLHQQPINTIALLQLQDSVYNCLNQQSDLLTKIGDVLAQSGKLAYWTTDQSALFTLLDASECPPTFGAAADQVWSYSNPAEILPDFSNEAFIYSRFKPMEIVPQLLICTPDVPAHEVAARRSAYQSFANLDILQLKCPAEIWHAKTQNTTGLSKKWLLNALTTLGFVRAGKVYGNRMIDLRISNVKLWDRAKRIISEIAQVTLAAADARMRAILNQYAACELTPQAMITQARSLPLVPLAILMERRQLSLKQAQQLLHREPRLIKAIQSR